MLRALIVDDEAPARSRLRKMLDSFVQSGRISLLPDAEDGLAAIETIAKQPVDLMFLDIRMPEMDGFTVIERIPPDNRPVVVFTTAYDEYAFQAFKANAVHYLMKPVSHDQLAESIERAERLRKAPEKKDIDEEKIAKLLDWLETQDQHPPTPAVHHNTSDPYVTQITIPHRDRLIITPVKQIVSIEVQDNITRLYALPEVVTQPIKLIRHIVPYTLEEMELRLNPDEFMRVHRAAIVRLDQIKEMITWFSGRYKLVMTGNHEVIASRERSKVLKKRLLF